MAHWQMLEALLPMNRSASGHEIPLNHIPMPYISFGSTQL